MRGRPFFAFPMQRRAMLRRRAHPLVEAVVDDVHAPPTHHAGRAMPRESIDHAPVGLVELDAEVVEDGSPEPLEVGRRTCHQLVEVAEAVLSHEGGEPARAICSGVGRHAMAPPNSN